MTPPTPLTSLATPPAQPSLPVTVIAPIERQLIHEVAQRAVAIAAGLNVGQGLRPAPPHHTHAVALVVGALLAIVSGAWTWLAVQVRDARLKAAIRAPAAVPVTSLNPAGLNPATGPLASEKEPAMNFRDTLDALPGKIGGLLTSLEPAALAALPADTVTNLQALAADAATEAKALAEQEIATAAAALPPALQPFSPLIAGLVDDQIAKVQAKADAEIAALTAAQAALPAAQPQA